MKQMKIALGLMIIGQLFGLTGCMKDTPNGPGGGSTNDQDAIMQMVQTDSLGEISASDETTINDYGPVFDDFGLQKEATTTRPLRWGRKIDNISRHIDVQIFGDSAAIATITKTITGSFIIAATYQDTGHIADTIITKPFTERVQRKIRFHRVARTEFYERNWIPVAITLVEGSTQPESVNLFTIRSIEYTFPWAKDTVTDPLNTWLRFGRVINGVPVLRVGDSVEVRLTVVSQDSQAERAVLRYVDVNPLRLPPFPVLGVRRIKMHLDYTAIGDGDFYIRSYSAKFYGALGNLLTIGRFHAVVDVMSHGSLYDDAQPFSNRFWGLPYIVVWR